MPSSAGKAVLPLSRENGFFDIWKIAKNRPRVQDFRGKADRFGVKFVDYRLDSLIWLYYHLVG